MTAAMIVLAVLLAVVLLALGLFLFACRRRPVPDFTKPAVIAQWGREDQTEEILAGITLMQDAEDIFLPSQDGLRLHGQLLQQPGAKGTILLFHGYRSSWIIDFSIVLPYYYSLGYNLLAVDERAHGQSEGVYITFGIHERRDAATWAQYAAMHFGPDHPLFLGGLSMGATTVLLASALELPPSVRGVIADCGFSSPEAIMRSVLRAHVKWLPAGPLLGAQAKLVSVVRGRVLDVAVDIRRGSPTFGRHVAALLDGENKRQLFIPRGFAHGFAVLSDEAVFQYKCDNYYAPGSEGGIAWDDPALAIDWRLPAGEILLSEKDRRHPKLADAPELFEYDRP